MIDVHQLMLQVGFRYTLSKRLPVVSILYRENSGKGYYTKDYDTPGGVFSTILIVPNDPHVELPTVYCYLVPSSYEGRLIPHISHDGYLCYVEQKEADWNPNDLPSLYNEIDCQIQRTLNNAVISMNDNDVGDIELQNEFVSYWESQGSLYLLADCSRKVSFTTVMLEPANDTGSSYCEFVTTEDTKGTNEDLTKWLTQRKLKLSVNHSDISTHYIRVNPTRLSGINWPPTSLKDLFLWLKQVDSNARSHLANSLYRSVKKRNILLLDIVNQDPIAVSLEMNTARLSNRTVSKRSTKKDKAGSVLNRVAILSSKHSCESFKRFSVTKADKKTLQSRNRAAHGDLSGKKIALVGCGTIGGYLAHLLLRNGAGSGIGYLHLYDHDEFKPHNFSRHSLKANDFGKNKAEALVDTLMDSIYVTKNIRGFGDRFPINESSLVLYDLVIDATGRAPISKRLAYVVRQMRDNERPLIIHAFNDGNGRAAKVFVDDGRSCYGCMNVDSSVHQGSKDNANMDLRFVDIDQAAERFVSCGSTYTTYDAAVSHITAAIAQEAALNTLKPCLPWSYSEFMLDERYRTGKRRILEKQSRCAICNDE
jgi:molybdopterin/thiamine biosynthesis adenylyltransferase|tara:strand:- start:1328 stop:3106 length:1779 start_codon:yes stop_codon:yes gene_type:complete